MLSSKPCWPPGHEVGTPPASQAAPCHSEGELGTTERVKWFLPPVLPVRPAGWLEVLAIPQTKSNSSLSKPQKKKCLQTANVIFHYSMAWAAFLPYKLLLKTAVRSCALS